jgi:uncharacterized membrane protein affecting hemolysin expression
MQPSPTLRLVLGYFSVCALSLVAIYVLAYQLYEQQGEVLIKEYGNTVARQLASSTVDAVIRSDLVSLHAQTEKLAEQDGIVDVTVYDMENHVLAQSGMPADRKKGLAAFGVRIFPASINFQDSVAGKVVVSLDTGSIKNPQRWLTAYAGICLALALGVIIALSRFWTKKARQLYSQMIINLNKVLDSSSQLSHLEHALPPLSEVNQTLAQLNEHIHDLEQRHPVPKLVPTGKHAFRPIDGSYAELMVECCNLKRLQQQLHHRELRRLIDHFEEQLDKASKLYHSINLPSPGNHVLLRFMVNDITDASLQAICCAIVLKGLLKANPPECTTDVRLEFRFIVHWHTHDERPMPDLLRNHLLQLDYLEMFQLCQRAKPGEILTTKDLKQSPAVAEHVKLDLISGDSETDYYRVQRISDSYKKLLEQQIQQLVTRV